MLLLNKGVIFFSGRGMFFFFFSPLKGFTGIHGLYRKYNGVSLLQTLANELFSPENMVSIYCTSSLGPQYLDFFL